MSAAPFSAGSIRLGIAVDSSTRAARSVTIVSTRPTGFSGRLFAGRSPGEVPGLVARMHALCGRSHWVAAEVAIIAALGRDVESVVAERLPGLAAERLGEHLRSIVTGSGAGRVETADQATLADVRAVLAGVHTLLGASVVGPVIEAAGAIDRIRAAIARLGLSLDRGGRLAIVSGSWAARSLAEVAEAKDDRFGECDPLGADDDEAVAAALAADPEGFSALPNLPGRRPEAGPAARAAKRGETLDGFSRFSARLAEIAEAAALLDAPATVRREAGAAWISGRQIGPRFGHGVVESPRGRLHHLAKIDEEGRVAAWAMLAPTEWNFHPEGPLAATLALNAFPAGPEAKVKAERIAALYDPCVAWEAVVEEVRDA